MGSFNTKGCYALLYYEIELKFVALIIAFCFSLTYRYSGDKTMMIRESWAYDITLTTDASESYI